MTDFKESDLYEPINKMLKDLGYDVKGEVKNCDIVAVNNGENTVIELKKAFNLKLVYQLIDRQSFSKYVYAAIPRPKKGQKDAAFKNMVKLLKKIDAGLITVALDSPLKTVDIIIEPTGDKKITSYKKKKIVENEFDNRTGSLNKGGINRQTIITAYREKSVELVCFVKRRGVVTPALLRENGFESKEYSIIYKNFYGWFEKTGKGQYTLSKSGEDALKTPEYSELVKYYTKKYK